jgi:hypothetical protein
MRGLLCRNQGQGPTSTSALCLPMSVRWHTCLHWVSLRQYLLMIFLMQKDFCDDQHRQDDQSVRREGGLREFAKISISLLQNVNHITA